jgi:hypothetical protein
MIPGAEHMSPGICLTGEENPAKPQLGDCLMKGCAPTHSLKWGPLPPNEVSWTAQHIREGKGRKKRKDRGWEGLIKLTVCLHYVGFVM